MTTLLSSLRRGVTALMLVFAVLLSGQAQAEEFIRVDVSNVAPQYRGAFTSAAATWNSLIKGYNPILPKWFRSTLSPHIDITAQTAFLDGPGNTLANAGPTDVRMLDPISRNPFERDPELLKTWAISQAGTMNFDIADMATLQAAGDLQDVVLHEMAHVLGSGTLWEQNGLTRLNMLTGRTHISGKHTNRGYEMDGASFGQTPLVEQIGGAGTAGGHWAIDDPILNQIDTTGRRDLMLGFLYVPNAQGQNVKGEIEIFNTTAMNLYDVGLWHSKEDGGDFTDGAFGGPNKWYGGVFPWTPVFQRYNATPEPGTALVVILGFVGLVARRRRN